MEEKGRRGKTFCVILKMEEILFSEVRADVMDWFLEKFEEFEDDDGFHIIDLKSIETVQKRLTRKEKADKGILELLEKLREGVLNEEDKTLLLRVP